MLLSLILLLASSTADPAVPVTKGYLALADQVDLSTFICIGTVVEILPVMTPETGERELPIARVAVERVLKGAPDTQVVHHEAWGIWLCDSTRAKVGQRALFFLDGSGEVARLGDASRRAVYDAIGSDVLLRNVHSGGGIVDIRRESDGEEELLGCSGAPDVLRFSRLAEIVRYVEQLVRFSPQSVLAFARRGSTPIHDVEKYPTFDLRILPDGQCRLARELGCRETLTFFQLEEGARSTLAQQLTELARGETRVVGDGSRKDTVRALAVRTGDATLDFVEPRDWSPSFEGTPEERLASRDALEAWSAIVAVVEIDGHDDLAERDRRWLARLR